MSKELKHFMFSLLFSQMNLWYRHVYVVCENLTMTFECERIVSGPFVNVVSQFDGDGDGLGSDSTEMMQHAGAIACRKAESL
jgi:hypothetical protein